MGGHRLQNASCQDGTDSLHSPDRRDPWPRILVRRRAGGRPRPRQRPREGEKWSGGTSDHLIERPALSRDKSSWKGWTARASRVDRCRIRSSPRVDDRFELDLELTADHRGRAMWRDMRWKVQRGSCLVHWTPEENDNRPLRWMAAPGGIRLLISNSRAENYPHRVDILVQDGRMVLMQSSQRELLLSR